VVYGTTFGREIPLDGRDITNRMEDDDDIECGGPRAAESVAAAAAVRPVSHGNNNNPGAD